MLFHYHFWTPYVEETEKFYVENGFRVSQRIGKYNGEFLDFGTHLGWDGFRHKKIIFRIIELKKGLVNITFGHATKIIFDHLGFLVSDEEENKICENAVKMNWKVSRGERRTFITTPYHFRIELQSHNDVIDSGSDKTEVEILNLSTKMEGLEKDLSTLFGMSIDNIQSESDDKVSIKHAIIKGFPSTNIMDPNGVRIFNSIYR